MSDLIRFELTPSDGMHGAQVLIADDDDLEYWKEQALKYGYVLGEHYYVQTDYSANYHGFAYFVYQILPKDLKP